jgi:hypothetical protein
MGARRSDAVSDATRRKTRMRAGPENVVSRNGDGGKNAARM